MADDQTAIADGAGLDDGAETEQAAQEEAERQEVAATGTEVGGSTSQAGGTSPETGTSMTPDGGNDGEGMADPAGLGGVDQTAGLESQTGEGSEDDPALATPGDLADPSDLFDGLGSSTSGEASGGDSPGSMGPNQSMISDGGSGSGSDFDPFVLTNNGDVIYTDDNGQVVQVDYGDGSGSITGAEAEQWASNYFETSGGGGSEAGGGAAGSTGPTGGAGTSGNEGDDDSANPLQNLVDGVTSSAAGSLTGGNTAQVFNQVESELASVEGSDPATAGEDTASTLEQEAEAAAELELQEQQTGGSNGDDSGPSGFGAVYDWIFGESDSDDEAAADSDSDDEAAADSGSDDEAAADDDSSQPSESDPGPLGSDEPVPGGQSDSHVAELQEQAPQNTGSGDVDPNEFEDGEGSGTGTWDGVDPDFSDPPEEQESSGGAVGGGHDPSLDDVDPAPDQGSSATATGADDGSMDISASLPQDTLDDPTQDQSEPEAPTGSHPGIGAVEPDPAETPLVANAVGPDDSHGGSVDDGLELGSTPEVPAAAYESIDVTVPATDAEPSAPIYQVSAVEMYVAEAEPQAVGYDSVVGEVAIPEEPDEPLFHSADSSLGESESGIGGLDDASFGGREADDFDPFE